MHDSVSFRIQRENPTNDLQMCLEEISKPNPPSNPAFALDDVVITRPVLVLLVQVLNRCQSNEPHSPGINWIMVSFHRCEIALPDTTTLQTLEDELYCSPDDLQTLASTVARIAKSCIVDDCPEFLRALCDVPQCEIRILWIIKWDLSTLDCARLADFLQRSVAWIDLFIKTMYVRDPLVLAEGLVNATHLKTISFELLIKQVSTGYPALGNVLVRQDGNGMVPRVIQSPASQIKRLDLVSTRLDDRHFITLVDMLTQPTSRITQLNVANNCISSHGILELARQLPSIQCLRKVDIGFNPWQEDTREGRDQECYAALLQGMLENYSIEDLSVAGKDNPSKDLLQYYTDLNCAGRRILRTCQPVPAGLWPLILERAGSKCFSATPESQEHKRANATYFLVQNCPVLHSVIHQ